MQLFFHDVGLKGATADFPKTIFGDIAVSDIVEHCPYEVRAEIQTNLLAEFPDGFCNAWGVPAGAKSVIRQLEISDVMLLIKSTGGAEEMPALCHVKAFWQIELLELSQFLWGSKHFPYVFFFKTQYIDLTWSKFKQDVQYLPKFRPAGNVYRVKSERLEHLGGAAGYMAHLIKNSYKFNANNESLVRETSPDYEYEEGERQIRETSYFKRNSKLVKDAKTKYGFKCQVCEFDFKSVYGDELGAGFIECHHKNPLAEQDDNYKSTLKDVCVVCSNCHRMLHRTKPALLPEELKTRMCK